MSQFKKWLILSHRTTHCLCLDNCISRIFPPPCSRILHEEILWQKFPWNGSSPLPPPSTHLQFWTCSRWHHSYTNPLFLSLFAFWPVFSLILPQKYTEMQGVTGAPTVALDTMTLKERFTLPILALTPLLSSPCNLLNLSSRNMPQDKWFYGSRTGFNALCKLQKTHPPTKRKESGSLWMQLLWETRLFG